MKHKNLTEKDIKELFSRLDLAAQAETASSMRFIIIGSAILIAEGMLGRSTIDIDFWKTTTQDHDALKKMAEKIGIDFNPNEDADRQEPYLQWVSPDFVHMPQDESWKDETQDVWVGQFMKIERPPIGVILGSKLAAGRQQDFVDVQYIVQSYPDWKQDLEKWLPKFSKEDQEDIQDNLVFVNMYLAQLTANKPETSIEKNKRLK